MIVKEIVVVLTNKGYVAIENNQIFDLWKNKPFKVIYEELHQRYPNYNIHLGSLDRIEFQQAVEVSNQYLTDQNELKLIKSQNINHKNHNKMKQLTFNGQTAKTLAKVTAGFTTQKLAGVLHGTLQTSADILQYGADKIAKGEAYVLDNLKLYNESNEALIKIRKERTKGYQKIIRQTPENIFRVSGTIKDQFKNLINNRKIKTVNHSS
jgi:hypothetical protein